MNFFSFLKNKIESSGDNYRFFVIANNISYVPNKLRGLFFFFFFFFFFKMEYEKKRNFEDFFKQNKMNYDKKLIKNHNNLNILFTKNELTLVSKSKTFNELKEKQIIKLIKDSVNNPDNILKIRDILYEINIKNIKMIQILRNILSYFLNENLDYDKKIRLCQLFAKYDHRVQMSYKAQIHYESLFMEIIQLLHC